MNLELINARVEGKTYDEIQTDIVKMTKYFCGKFYQKYPVLKLYNYDVESAMLDVWNNLYRRNNEGVANLERYFIEASKKGFSMKYIMNIVKRITTTSLLTCARDLPRKPVVYSLDDVINNSVESEDKELSMADTIVDTRESTENILEYKELLESLPNRKLKEYYYMNAFGEKRVLTTNKILDWYIEGYNITETANKIFSTRDDLNISHKEASRLRKIILEDTKDYLRGEVYGKQLY